MDYLIKHMPTGQGYAVPSTVGTPCRAIGYIHNINLSMAKDISEWSICVDGTFTTYNNDWSRTNNCCPWCGGEADNGFSRDVPPMPYACSKCGGVEYEKE